MGMITGSVDDSKIIVKTPKAKKAKKDTSVTVHVERRDAFCPRSTQDFIRPVFRVIPSPKSIIFPVGKETFTIGREAKKGATAKWFLVDSKGGSFEGTKNAIRLEVGMRICLAHREQV